MTKLEIVNKFFFQWFFVRLARCEQSYSMQEVVKIDFFAPLSTDEYKEYRFRWYSLMTFVVPLTGWGAKYKYLGKKRFYRITKKKMVGS